MNFVITATKKLQHSEEFTKRVREMSSQLFVCRGIDRQCIQCNKQLRRHLPNPFRQFPSTINKNKQLSLKLLLKHREFLVKFHGFVCKQIKLMAKESKNFISIKRLWGQKNTKISCYIIYYKTCRKVIILLLTLYLHNFSILLLTIHMYQKYPIIKQNHITLL